MGAGAPTLLVREQIQPSFWLETWVQVHPHFWLEIRRVVFDVPSLKFLDFVNKALDFISLKNFVCLLVNNGIKKKICNACDDEKP